MMNERTKAVVRIGDAAVVRCDALLPPVDSEWPGPPFSTRTAPVGSLSAHPLVPARDPDAPAFRPCAISPREEGRVEFLTKRLT